MKSKIIAQNWQHLTLLIIQEINTNGNNCDLNHIDVSNVNNMDRLFEHLNFNGDISQWDTSNAETMECTFHGSRFNGNVSKVKNMHAMFADSNFNGDISNWDISNVDTMNSIFYKSAFKQDLTQWKPYKLKDHLGIFKDTSAPLPYWIEYADIKSRNKAIDKYVLSQELSVELNDGRTNEKKLKI